MSLLGGGGVALCREPCASPAALTFVAERLPALKIGRRLGKDVLEPAEHTTTGERAIQSGGQIRII